MLSEIRLTAVLRLMLAFVILLSLNTFARSDDGNPDENASVYDLTFNDLVTQSLVRDLQSMKTECTAAAPVYRLDCVRQGLELTSRKAPFHGDYGSIRSALQSAAADLGSLIRSNSDADSKHEVVPPGTNPRFKTRRYYTAVAQYSDLKTKTYSLLDLEQSQLLKLANKTSVANKHLTAVAIAFAALTDILRR